MKKVLLFSAIVWSLNSIAQVGIGTPTANASAALDVTSTTKGVLFPRMTESQRLSMITLPAAAQGLLVYQTDGAQGFYYNTSITTTPNWTYLSASTDNTPAGTIMAYAGTSAPSGWAFCNGSTLSRGANASLFSIIGTTYGAGDGTTTFTLPDLRGRTAFGHDVMGNVAANRLTTANGINGSSLGAAGGSQTQTISTSYLPAHTHGVNITSSTAGSHTHDYNDAYFAENISGNTGVGNNQRYGTSGASDTDNSFRFRTSADGHSNSKDNIATSSNGSHSHTVTGNTESTGSGTAMPIVNPGLVLNYIIKL